MPTSPAANERFAVEIARIYGDAEARLIELIANRLARGMERPGWADAKLREVQALHREAQGVVRDLQAANREVAAAILDSYDAGGAEALREVGMVPEHLRAVARLSFGMTHEEAVKALVDRTVGNLRSTHLRILREADDIYRASVLAGQEAVVVGDKTTRQAVQDSLRRFADKGVTGFTDSRGRKWELSSYAEMAVRSGSGQAAVQGHINRLQQAGYDLVIVSDSPEECPLCAVWERRVLRISAIANTRYPHVSEAIRAGLFHANCTHTLGLYVPGLTEAGGSRANPAGYEQRQEQRRIEREVRRWKRREAAAITPEEQAHTKAKRREWQAASKQFADDTGRLRRYDRESIRY